jgi:hypothetical protein
MELHMLTIPIIDITQIVHIRFICRIFRKNIGLFDIINVED